MIVTLIVDAVRVSVGLSLYPSWCNGACFVAISEGEYHGKKLKVPIRNYI